MQRMKLFALSVIMAAALFSCGDDYDDTALKKEIDDLKTRVEKLEDWCDTANGQISALQGLVSAMEQNDYITGVTPVVEGTKETGYIITFAKSDPITIFHGKNGTDGTDGDAGITPIIGAKQDTDGNYYWTIKTGDEDPVWMTDAEGNKIRTTGDDAVAVKPVISVDIDTDGKLYWKIDGEWLLDKENKKVPATGEKGDKGDKGDTGATGGSGSQGAAGEQGPKGDAVFADNGVNVDAAGSVTFTLADGTTFTVPRSVAISIGTDGIFYYTTEKNTVPINLPTNFTQDDYASIMAEVKSSYGTSVDIKTREVGGTPNPQWDVKVTAPAFDDNGAYTPGSAQVTLTAPSDIAGDANAWLEVTILDAKGKKSTAACVIKVTDGVPVTTPDDLNNALAANGDVDDSPTKIILEDNITASSLPATIAGTKELDGNGKTLTSGVFTISSDNDASPSSLTMSNTTLVSPQLSVSNNGTLTLGNEVEIKSSNDTPITIAGSGVVEINGATFTGNDATAGDFNWISVGETNARSSFSRSTDNPATLKLEDITISNSNDFILITSKGQLQIKPGGIKKAFKLYLDNIQSTAFSISSTAGSGSLTDSDLNMLSIHASSTIDGKDGDGYELYLDNGVIKLRAKSTGAGITTYEALTAAIAAADGTKEAPTVITLGADITVPVCDDGIPSVSIGSDDGTNPRHIRLEGGGHSLIAAGDGIKMMQVYTNSSLALANITLDGADKKTTQSLLSIVPNATAVLGNGTILQNLPSYQPLPGFVVMSYGITLSAGTASLTVESGAIIRRIGGYAISLNNIRNSNCITLNGGTFTDNGTDIRLAGADPDAPSPVYVGTLPAGSGSNGKPSLEVIFASSRVESAAIAGGNSLSAEAFELKKVKNGNGQELTGYEFYMDNGILKLRQQAPAGITAAAVKAALAGTGTDAIVIDADLTLTEQITMGASHTLTIADGVTLTIGGDYGRIAIGGDGNTLTINGGGTLVANRDNSLWKQTINADGSDDLILDGNVTVKVTRTSQNPSRGGINVHRMTVKQGAKVELNASNASKMININTDGSLTVGGTIDIQSFSGIGIFNLGTMTIQSTGEVKVGAGDSNDGYTNQGIRMRGDITLESGGTLSNGTNGNGGIYLTQGYHVTGMNGRFSDRGTVFTATDPVKVGAADADASAGGLTQGLYVWDGTRFARTAE